MGSATGAELVAVGEFGAADSAEPDRLNDEAMRAAVTATAMAARLRSWRRRAEVCSSAALTQRILRAAGSLNRWPRTGPSAQTAADQPTRTAMLIGMEFSGTTWT